MFFCSTLFFFFFFNDTATTEIYTLSLHDALPILVRTARGRAGVRRSAGRFWPDGQVLGLDRKSTRLNSSHLVISYAVFCLKKKKQTEYMLVPQHLPYITQSRNFMPSRLSEALQPR